MFRCKGLIVISYLSIFLYNSSFVGKSPVKDINIPSNSKKMKQHIEKERNNKNDLLQNIFLIMLLSTSCMLITSRT